MATHTNPFIRGYSRCWEISTAHLPWSAIQYLQHLADHNVPTGVMFEPFRVPHHLAVGCKLLCTPWPSDPIETIFSDEPQTLRQLQLLAGIPDSVIDLLHLAAVADTRILILDPNAPALDGLRTYQ